MLPQDWAGTQTSNYLNPVRRTILPTATKKLQQSMTYTTTIFATIKKNAINETLAVFGQTAFMQSNLQKSCDAALTLLKCRANDRVEDRLLAG
jgi:hypothetical protein